MLDSVSSIFSNAYDQIMAALGPLAPLFLVGLLGVLLIAITLPIFLNRKQDPLEKIKAQRLGKAVPKTNTEGKALRHDDPGKKLDRFSQYLEPQDTEQYSNIRLQLIQAGYRNKSAVRIYHFAQFALGLGLLFAGVVYTMLSGNPDEETSMQSIVISVLLPGFVGYYLPRYWVTKRIGQRQEEITNGFPDSLDLMLVCVEAGQGLDQAIIRVADEIRAGFPALSEEYEMVAWEIKAGKDKVTVLKDMAERCGVTDVTSFVTVLIQSQTFGTSIADALRVYAGEMRDKRVMRAEEKANVLPTKLTLGTMMFTVPPLMIILIGPSVYSIMETLGNSGQ